MIVYLIFPRKEGRATGCCCGLGGENTKGRDNLEEENKKTSFRGLLAWWRHREKRGYKD
jgi:hypothetical protein